MFRYRIWKAGLLATLTGGIAYGTDFTWINGGGGLNQSWDHCGNWFYIGSPSPCYPADTGDDATIPKKTSGSWTIKVVNIDALNKLTIYDSVTFTTQSGTPCLVTERLVINPTAGGTTHDVIVIVQDGAGVGSDCLQ